MVRKVDHTDLANVQHSKDIRQLTELMGQAVQLISQAANKPVVVQKAPDPVPYPERLEAEIIRNQEGKLTRIVVRPVYG